MSNITAVKGEGVDPEEYNSMTKAHFLVVVAKDAIAREWGSKINNWPTNNYWAIVSCVKYTIQDDQVPDLMARYNITKLSDFPF